MQKIDVTIEEDFITLGQLLKNVNLISSGGMAKWYLNEFFVFVNEEEEQRRGRKLYPNDVILFPNEELEVKILAQDG
ncbi:S4 domain-containing protein YaaA [Facklamia sp. DSM 111018]|uniref:S4 domain-containing protein YaaA n=1 Tax=Facklamia lactis TaxID=2749967 RepID=A0ABS0LSS9_9LACT|nr:S4 domain-containing protein YaaA [Facklamia lactis]MBG9981307.1 S4 domain-containing protein YaaA [Facklamia lactis]MBG9987217.1 S4 domain-containing protein YaaA [Facklamia lactis]